MRLGDITEGFSGANFNLGSALGSALGAFIGAKLGAMVVNPQTQAAVTLSSIGSAVGAYVAVAQIGTAIFGTGKLASMLGNMIVPGIGAFVGFVLGALIGNLFGRKKPKTPTANAEIYLDYTSDQFQLGLSSAQNGGNLQLVRNMAETARDTLNGFLTVLAGDMPYEATSWGNGLWRNGKYIASDAGLQSFYGHTGGQLWVKLGSPSATQQNVASADDAVSKGVMWSIKQTQIIGGDIFAKRALANSAATDLTALLGDLQIASDYRFYAENRELINGYITGAYNSLNQGEKDYYAAHKATIDKAHTQGLEALDGNELAFYNGNKATIDKIISALEDQAIANPWIITLQRINELKLDQWNSSDFNGGLQGFLTSMGLESYGVYMENIQAAAVGAGARLSVRGVEYTTDPESSAARIWRLYDAALDRTADTNGLHSWTGLLDAGRSLHSIAEGFLGSAEFSAAGTLTNAQFVVLIYTRALNRTPAQWEIDAKVSELNGGRSRAQILVDISESPEHRAITAAAIAAGLSVQRGLGAFSLLAQAESGGRSVVVDDLTKVGYTKLTEGNTSGRDFLDFSQRTSTVDWRDVSQTTEYETYYDQYGYEYQQEITVTHTGGDDIVVGSRYGDYLSGAAGWDWIDGGEGDDTLEGGDGNDVLLGRQGRDRLIGGAGDDYLWGGADDDNPWDGSANAGMWGGTGNDTFVFAGGRDLAVGEDGDDVFLMEQDGYTSGLEASGNYDWSKMDYVDAAAGSDTISYERFTTPFAHNLDVNFWPWATNTSAMPVGGINGVAVYLGNHPTSWTNGDAYWADAKYIMGDFVKGVENVTGSKFNDYLWGDAGNNIIKGGDGNDFLDGHLGNDILEGGAGADYMVGPGEGTLSYEGSNAGVFIDMTTGEAFGGHATGDRWYAMDHLTGSRFADELKGDSGSNRVKGLDGDDWIVATVGSDVYEGGDGLDTVDYSAGFASGNSTYQVWVEDGYWETDQWDQSSQWISTGGHYETQTGYRAGLQVNGGIAEWRAVDGTAGTHNLIGVEHIIGTSGDDFIAMTGGDDYITGGKGNDTLAGGGGSDTYYFNRGDGFDQLVEDNSGSNTLSFSGDVKVGDLGFGWRSHATGVFDIYIQGTGDHIQVNGNVVEEGNNKLKVIDFNGAGQLDVSGIIRFRAGGNGDDVFSGEPGNRSDLLVGHGGNDTIYGAPSNGWESQGNVFIGGSGNDQFNASTGDDQYAFDVGDGQDVIYDSGGDDTLVFGATVTADSVRTEVVNGDLRIFYGGAGDYVTVYGGGTRLNDISTGVTVWNTVEFINAGGTWIDIRKLDINWLNQDYYGGGWAPIVLDLGGDGLDLVGVDQSQIVSRLDSGQVARTGWVGATDGMLAVDRDGDGQINHLSEISFTQDKDGAKTDLEGLRAWDTNGDGKITILDEGWSKLKVWVDRNQNGRSTDGELRTLEQAGITTIDLTGQGTGMTAAMTRDNFVHNTLSFTWSDGRQGTAYDVNLARKLLQEKGLTREQVIAAWGTLGADGELGRLLNDPAAQALLAATLGETALRRPSAFVQKGMTRADILSAELMLEDIDLDVVVPDASSSITLETILANAQFDFSDHDNTYAEDEQRLREKLEAALRGDDYVRTDEGVLGSLFEGEGVRGAFGHAFGRPDIDDGASDAVMGTGLNEAAAGTPLSLADGQVGRPERVLEADLGRDLNDDVQMPEIDQAASLLSAVTDESDVWAPAEFSRASSGAGRQWWRSEVLSPDDLSVAAPVGTFDLSSAIEANAQGAVASQHQQLVQALAAFGPKAGGGSSAIWKRSGEVEDGHLAGSSSDTGRWRFAGPSRIHA